MNAGLHRIEVHTDADDLPISVTFVCDGDDAAPCHHWPACECETWGQEHGWPDGEAKPGHGNVQQESCWIDPWFNDALLDLTDWLEAYEGDDEPTADTIRSGAVEAMWEGDYMTWSYADVFAASEAAR